MNDDDLTQTIIGCAYKIHNVLGHGFFESVYENALRIELESLASTARLSANTMLICGLTNALPSN